MDEAIELINSNPWGNGTALFTNSGPAARKYTMEIDSGQVSRCSSPSCAHVHSTGWHQRAHPRASAHVLLHWQQGFIRWRPQLLRQGWCAILHATQDSHKPVARGGRCHHFSSSCYANAELRCYQHLYFSYFLANTTQSTNDVTRVSLLFLFLLVLFLLFLLLALAPSSTCLAIASHVLSWSWKQVYHATKLGRRVRVIGFNFSDS